MSPAKGPWHVVAWAPDPRDPYRPARSLVSLCCPSHALACVWADRIAAALAAHGPRGAIVEVFQAQAVPPTDRARP